MKSKKIILICCIVIASLLLISLIILIFKDDVQVTLVGQKKATATIYTDYKDAGFILKNRDRVVDAKKYTYKVISDVDSETLGTYNYKYIITYKGKEYVLTRIVDIIDDVVPEITSSTEEIEQDYCSKKILTDYTYTALDNYDGDITDMVTIDELDDQLILNVIDSNGNKSSKEINIHHLDKPDNVFSLKGNSTVYVPFNTQYKEQGTIYEDGCGNELKASVNIKGLVDTHKIGDYSITYELANEKTLKRVVKVYDPNVPAGKIIYLTFDDGPSYYTKSILDTLSKYNVKATFFVTNQFPDYNYMIKEEYNKGHAIGVHTYTHKYDVYSSLESYIDDFNKMNEVIKEQTGEYSKMFRFPGGASNTISKSYKKGIVSEVAQYMIDNGYVYFDWNVDSTDAAGAGVNGIYKRVTTDVSKCNKCVVLMHDIKKTTAEALDSILFNLTSRGYSFQVLTPEGPIVQHKISN